MIYSIVNFDVKLVGVNHRLCFSHGKWYTTNEYKKCKEDLSIVFSKMKIKNLEKAHIVISVSRNQWRGDLDNCIKVILDALVLSHVIQDDSRKVIEKIEVGSTDDNVSQLIVKEIK